MFAQLHQLHHHHELAGYCSDFDSRLNLESQTPITMCVSVYMRYIR